MSLLQSIKIITMPRQGGRDILRGLNYKLYSKISCPFLATLKNSSDHLPQNITHYHLAINQAPVRS